MEKNEKQDIDLGFEYTQEELGEIDRIVNSLPGALKSEDEFPEEDQGSGDSDYLDLSGFGEDESSSDEDISDEEISEEETDDSDVMESEPITGDDEESGFDMPEDLLSSDGDDAFPEEFSIDNPDDITDDMSEELDSFDDIPEEDIDDSAVQDITTLIEEVPEEDTVSDDAFDDEMRDGISGLDDLSSDESLSDDFDDLATDGDDSAMDDLSSLGEDSDSIGFDSDEDTGLDGLDDISGDISSDIDSDFGDSGDSDDVLGELDGLEDLDSSDAEDDFADIDIPAVEQSADEDGPVTTMGQLNNLTKDEPDSVDDQEIDDEVIVDNTISKIPDAQNEESLPEFDALPEEDPEIEAEPQSKDVTLESENTDDIPDLSDLSLDDVDSVSEADDSDIPSVDLDGFDDGLEDLDDLDDSASSLDDIDSFDDSHLESMDEPDLSLDAMDDIEEDSASEDAVPPIDDMFSDVPDIPDIDQVDEVLATEPIPDIPDTIDEPSGSSSENESLDLTADELKKVKKALLLFPPGLTDVIKDTILNDRLPAKDIRRLVDMILDGRPENNIHRFLEKKLAKKIDKDSGTDRPQRRALYARKEYTAEGRERQKALMRKTALIASIALVTASITFLSYQYIYKPLKAKSLINKGVELIVRENDPKIPDYKEAEGLFDRALTYQEEYLYGYNRYGRAYFKRKEYDRALDKFNQGYDIAFKDKFHDVTILNNLGYFFTRMPDRFFNRIKPEMDNYYYKDKYPPLEKINTKYDAAIDFYRKALNMDPENIESMFGIGNTYFAQGRYLKARNYYEDILKKDPDSVVGYSGLLNLFIEKDDFPEAVEIFVALRNKGIMEDVPSPLLGKLAGYFLGKSRSDAVNIRIDYGIQSPRLKDSDDQPFPAVLTVLRSLKNKDPDYPPLYLYYAKLADKMKNYKLVERHLQRALEKAENNKEDYFDARHMLGEFYYKTKNPVKAYKNLKMAVAAYKNPASFTYDDFYSGTEEVGRTHALMGNIFYYFFDRVRFDMGDQESITPDDIEKIEDKMANFLIAQEKYEKALSEGYSSGELHYNLGRIYYLNKDYEKAMNQWLNLYEEFTVSPELMFALGNVFYKMNNYDSAKAQYMKLTDLYEYEASKIKNIKRQNPKHIKIFRTLSAAYNNLGVVYQVQGNEERSNICYWKSIEYAKMLEQESEFSRVNIARSFKERTDPIVPIVDDNIPYSINYFREDMRQY